MKSLTYALLLSVLIPFTAHAEIHTESVEYKDGDAVLEGYLAYDDALTGKRPGILVVPEWKGLNDYAKRRARMLAELGYVAFAADMYGKGVRAETHEEAAKLSGVYRGDRMLMRKRAEAGLNVLLNSEHVNAEKVGAIGYCFGATTVLELARGGYPLKGVVSFHGALGAPNPARAGEIKAKVLVFHGALDNSVNPDVEGFKKEMSDAGADMKFVSFKGAVHSFTVPEAGNDPSSGMAHNEQADHASWDAMKEFFKELFLS